MGIVKRGPILIASGRHDGTPWGLSAVRKGDEYEFSFEIGHEHETRVDGAFCADTTDAEIEVLVRLLCWTYDKKQGAAA